MSKYWKDTKQHKKKRKFSFSIFQYFTAKLLKFLDGWAWCTSERTRARPLQSTRCIAHSHDFQSTLQIGLQKFHLSHYIVQYKYASSTLSVLCKSLAALKEFSFQISTHRKLQQCGGRAAASPHILLMRYLLYNAYMSRKTQAHKNVYYYTHLPPPVVRKGGGGSPHHRIANAKKLYFRLIYTPCLFIYIYTFIFYFALCCSCA